MNTTESSKAIRKRIKKSREGMARLTDSAGHVSSVVEFSEKIEFFLEEVEQKVDAQEEKKESWFKRTFSFICLLLSFNGLLLDVLTKAKNFLEQIVGRN